MNEEVMTREMAEAEISEWLDFKRIRQDKRSDMADNIDVLVEAMMYGELKKDGQELTQTLIEPIGQTTELTYQPRVKQKAVNIVQTKNKVKTTEAHALMACYVAAITGKSYGVVSSMVTEDWRVAQAIVLFFT